MESNRDPNSDNYTDYLPFLLEYKKISNIKPWQCIENIISMRLNNLSSRIHTYLKA